MTFLVTACGSTTTTDLNLKFTIALDNIVPCVYNLRHVSISYRCHKTITLYYTLMWIASAQNVIKDHSQKRKKKKKSNKRTPKNKINKKTIKKKKNYIAIGYLGIGVLAWEGKLWNKEENGGGEEDLLLFRPFSPPHSQVITILHFPLQSPFSNFHFYWFVTLLLLLFFRFVKRSFPKTWSAKPSGSVWISLSLSI